MVMYFKQLLKHSVDNDMTYLKPELPPVNVGHLVMNSEVYLPTLFQLRTLLPIPLDMCLKPIAFL